MNSHDQTIIHSSEEPDWITPPTLWNALNDVFRFDLDAAGSARDHYGPYWLGPGSRLANDGLTVSWRSVGFLAPPIVFLNPPYSKTRYRETRNLAYQVERWAEKCWLESCYGCTVVGLFPFAPQTEWYRRWVYGHSADGLGWTGHAAMEEWRLAHRVSFVHPRGQKASNAGVNSVVIVWKPNPGFVGPWLPAVRYWSYRPTTSSSAGPAAS